MRRRRAAAVLAVGAATVALAGACGDDEPTRLAEETTSTAEADVLAGDLPPTDTGPLEIAYRDDLADLGFELTDRGGLIDRSDGGYEVSPTGDHLALYVRPTREHTITEYVEGIRSVTVVFADVFDRWPELASFDVCQEPLQLSEATDDVVPLTQIEMTREQAAAIDWETVTAADLITASQADPPGITLRMSSVVLRDPAVRALVEGPAS